MDRVSIKRMRAGKEFQVEGADTDIEKYNFEPVEKF